MVSILEIYIFLANLENGNYARNYFFYCVPHHVIRTTRKHDQFIIFLLCVVAIVSFFKVDENRHVFRITAIV